MKNNIEITGMITRNMTSFSDYYGLPHGRVSVHVEDGGFNVEVDIWGENVKEAVQNARKGTMVRIEGKLFREQLEVGSRLGITGITLNYANEKAPTKGKESS
jgi:hypothetical protein